MPSWCSLVKIDAEVRTSTTSMFQSRLDLRRSDAAGGVQLHEAAGAGAKIGFLGFGLSFLG